MRYKLSFALLICFSVVAFSCKTNYKPVLQSPNGIKFKVSSLSEGLKESKATNKPLFVFAHASWCPTCKKMEQEVLTDKDLGDAYNSKYINVAIDVDSPDGKILQKSFPIRATPTLFFFSADGSLEKKAEGFTTIEELKVK